MDSTEETKPTEISFKRVKKRPIRSAIEDIEKTADDSKESDDEEAWSKLEAIKLSKSLNKRVCKGLDAAELLVVKNKEQLARDKTENIGGLLDLKNTFSVEKNQRDEDEDMLKFVEEQLSKRKGIVNQEESKAEKIDMDELVFKKIREESLLNQKKKNEEMLSSQMLCGIPEIDLGVEEKIRNIEATEEAKMKLIEKKIKQRSSSRNSTLVPTNIAANYVQHNRFNVDTSHHPGHNNKKGRYNNPPAPTLVKEPVVVIGDEPKQNYFRSNTGQGRSKLGFPGKEKATDDYHFEKFKKQFRK